MVKRGALVEATHDEAHLADGSFSSERMLRLLNEAMETALKDGFTGLRACGDMSWLLAEPEGPIRSSSTNRFSTNSSMVFTAPACVSTISGVSLRT